MKENDFNEMMEEIFKKGGSPEYSIIEGIGEIYWPSLSSEEKAFIGGWLACREFLKDYLPS